MTLGKYVAGHSLRGGRAGRTIFARRHDRYTGRGGEAGIHAGYDPGRRERLGRLAALLQLPEAARAPARPPLALFRAVAQNPRPARPRALPRLLRPAGGRRLVPRGRVDSRARRARRALAALARPGPPVPP